MKNRAPLRLLYFLFLSLANFACKDDDIVERTNRLSADAGESQTVDVNTVVNLDGSASKDGNQQSFSFHWKFVARPPQSAAVIQESFSASPRFTADLPGVYVLELTISQNQFVDTDQVVITASAASPSPTMIFLEGDITSDRTLEDIFEDPAQPDYSVIGDVNVKAKLTVRPGVVVQFEAEKSLHIFPDGILVAKGTSTERIIFTGREKVKGYWKGLLFSSNHPENELDHVLVAFGGSPEPEMGLKANIVLMGNDYSGAAIRISNSSFWESAGYGLYVAGKSQLNYFSGNYFTNNTTSALYVPAGQLHQLDFFSHYTGNNGFDGIETGGTVNLEEDVTWTHFNDGSKYLVTQDLHLQSGVTISEGANLEFSANRVLRVEEEGYLKVTGSQFKPVVFSARHKTADQFWKGIVYTSGNEHNQLSYAIVSHAGSSMISEINERANLGISTSARVTVSHSTFQTGLGWGIAAAEGAQVNPDITTVNYFDDLVSGAYNLSFSDPETTTLSGIWVDEWSFNHENFNIEQNFFNTTTNTWFNGAEDPWQMNPASAFGLQINEDGSYLWTIAERSPWTGECISYSAEYITGNVQEGISQLVFTESFWRTRFYTSCDPEQNVDTNIEPGTMTLRYEINKVYNLFTGMPSWQLKFTNPDNSSFSYYRKIDQ